MKRIFFVFVFLVINSVPASAVDDIDSLCEVSRKDWVILSNGSVGAMKEFQGLLNSSVCPQLYEQVSKRIEIVSRQDHERQLMLDALRSQSKRSAEDEVRMKLLERELEDQQKKRGIAEAALERERAERRRLEEIYQPKPSSKSYISCDIETDIASIDQGNINGFKFDRISVSPREQIMYDLSRLDEGFASVYQVDRESGEWIRLKIGAQRSNSVIMLGSSAENEGSTVNFLSKFEFDQVAMSIRGIIFAEMNVDRSVNFNVRGNNAEINFGNAFRRPPRLWVESVGRCSYLASPPTMRIGERSSVRVKSRIIPNIPKMPN